MPEKTHYQKCREAGKCISCPNPSPASARCADCRQKRKELHAQRRIDRICADCGGPNDNPNSVVRCIGCNSKKVALYAQRKLDGVCPHCGRPSLGPPGSHCASCQKKNRKRDRKKYFKLREQVLNHYSAGKPACKCCGEATIQFLQVDHIEHRAGAKHRREIGNGGLRLYTWIRKHGFPVGFQVLCANCNHAKGRFGECPHEAVRRFEAAEPLDMYTVKEVEATNPSAARIIRDSRRGHPIGTRRRR